MHTPTMPHEGFDYRLFFELSADPFCIAGYDGFFKKVNNAVCDLLGYTSEELMSAPIRTFIHEEDKQLTEDHRRRLTSGSALVNFENRYMCKNGSFVWLAWTSMPLPEQGLVYAVAKNITHIKTKEEDRTNAIKNLTRVNDDLRLLTYTTSHDLRAPVNNLIGVFKMLNPDKIKDQETLEFIQLLSVVTENLKDTINNYSSILNEIDIVKVDTETLSFKACFDKVQRSLSTYIKNTGASITTHFEADEVVFNKGYLESIFLNLLSNAIKYAKPDQAPDITISTSVNGNNICLVFADQGIGFDMERVKDKIFGFGQKFTSIADSKGVGLYLVNNHVKNLGGSIEVESIPGNGATFKIYFPVK